LPSSSRDFLNSDLRPHIEKYYRGSGISAEERVKLLKMVWDAIGTEFGGRHELYEINYAGNTENIRLEALKMAEGTGKSAADIAFAESALNDYDLNGWTNETWINPSTVEELVKQ